MVHTGPASSTLHLQTPFHPPGDTRWATAPLGWVDKGLTELSPTQPQRLPVPLSLPEAFKGKMFPNSQESPVH